MGPDTRVTLVFPSPYIRHAPTPLTIERMDGGELVVENHTVSYEEAFRAELHHFHEALQVGPRARAVPRRRARRRALDPPDRGRLRGRARAMRPRARLALAPGAGRRGGASRHRRPPPPARKRAPASAAPVVDLRARWRR